MAMDAWLGAGARVASRPLIDQLDDETSKRVAALYSVPQATAPRIRRRTLSSRLTSLREMVLRNCGLYRCNAWRLHGSRTLPIPARGFPGGGEALTRGMGRKTDDGCDDRGRR